MALPIIPVDSSSLRQFLETQEQPVMEILLLREFTGYRGQDDDLYQHHFSLSHALYQLKQDIAREQLYLHTDSMRIRLVPVPGGNQCSYYHNLKGEFCQETAESGNYCAHHQQYQQDDSRPVLDVLTGFYLDPENITFGSSDLLERLMSGFFHFVLNRKEVERAQSIMGINRITAHSLRLRYRELTRKWHPDRPGGDVEKMKQVSWAYSLLRDIHGF